MASQSGQVHNCRPAGRTAHWLRRRGGLYIAGFTKHGWQSEPHRPGKNGVCKRWDTLQIISVYSQIIAAGARAYSHIIPVEIGDVIKPALRCNQVAKPTGNDDPDRPCLICQPTPSKLLWISAGVDPMHVPFADMQKGT